MLDKNYVRWAKPHRASVNKVITTMRHTKVIRQTEPCIESCKLDGNDDQSLNN